MQISVNIFFSILIVITFLGLAVELAHASFPVHLILSNKFSFKVNLYPLFGYYNYHHPQNFMVGKCLSKDAPRAHASTLFSPTD